MVYITCILVCFIHDSCTNVDLEQASFLSFILTNTHYKANVLSLLVSVFNSHTIRSSIFQALPNFQIYRLKKNLGYLGILCSKRPNYFKSNLFFRYVPFCLLCVVPIVYYLRMMFYQAYICRQLILLNMLILTLQSMIKVPDELLLVCRGLSSELVVDMVM